MPVAHPTHHRFKDITGQRFTRWIVVDYAGHSNNVSWWNCRCDCGKEAMVRASNLTSGSSKSCGCFGREMASSRHIKHGMRGTRTYQSWISMVRRCTKSTSVDYPDYGGRGISVDPRWLDFKNFLEDMGIRPAGMSIDRKDNQGNYTKSNCRWSTGLVQANNKRTNRLLTYCGKTLNVSQWAKEIGTNPETLFSRIHRGWSVAKMLTTPIEHHRRL